MFSGYRRNYETKLKEKNIAEKMIRVLYLFFDSIDRTDIILSVNIKKKSFLKKYNF